VATTLILIGIGCIIAGIAGGGISLYKLSFPSVTSVWRQGLLAFFGAVLSLAGAVISDTGEAQGSNQSAVGGGVSNVLEVANSGTANVAEADATSNTVDNGVTAEEPSNATGSSDAPPQGNQ
jgi:hypothetical protein